MPRTEHVADIVRTTSLVDVDYEPVFLDMRISETEFAKNSEHYRLGPNGLGKIA